MAGCLVMLLAATAGASPKVPTEYKVETYKISGYSIATLAESMQKKSPVKHFAFTKWDIKWRYRFFARNGTSRLKSFGLNLTVEYTIPEWPDSERAGDELRGEWERYLRAVKKHESGHAAIGEACAKQILRHMKSRKWQAASNKELTAIIERECTQLLKEYQAKEVEYDKRTDHGKTQGARFGEIEPERGRPGTSNRLR